MKGGRHARVASNRRPELGVQALGIPNPGNPPHGVVTISAGVLSLGPDDLGATDEEWIARADAALYRAKANGRNRCEVSP